MVQVFGVNLQKVTNIFLEKKPKLLRIIQNGAIINFFPSFIVLLRKNPNYFTREKNLAGDLKVIYGRNWRYYIFIAPLIVLPLPAASIYNVFLNALRRILSPILI